MYLVPQPKKIRINDGVLCAYEYDIVLDKNCENNIFIAAKDLKNVMVENGFTNTKIVKPLTKRENCIFLTFEEKGGQGYSLNVNEKGIIVKGESQQGLFFGIQTLKQIIMQIGINVPYMEINDCPDMKERGYYLDISRGRVPTLDGVKKFVDKLALYKYTSFQLYIEHSFAFEGFEETFTHQGFLTAEEILEIDKYCIERYIELVPSFSSFGHLYNLLQSKSYQKYAELENYQPRVHKWQESREHHTIDVSNPESMEVIKKMFDQVIPLFTSNKFNICCDETMDVGLGRGKEMADKIGKGQMYVNHLNNLCAYLKEQGKEVMFWSDVIRSHTELVPQLPKDIICLLWEYNNPLREARVKPIMETTMRKYICPWTAGACRFVPLYHGTGYVAYDNIKATTDLAKEGGIEGFLLTDWGDFGHTCHAELRFPVLAYGGALSWNFDGNADVNEFDKYISLLEYGNENVLGILKQISAKSKVFEWNNLVGEFNKKSASVDLDCENKPTFIEPDENMVNAYNDIYKLESEVAGCKMNECRDAIITAVKATRLIIAIKLAEKYPVMDNFALANEIEKWFEEYALVWRKENKESELYRIYEFIEHYCAILRTK
ncbi:MAG: family 20 glycosylhydrolase [Clostridia bacterium]|nr:family 20 glycosylhydrolase [Clostridia bacterium]